MRGGVSIRNEDKRMSESCTCVLPVCVCEGEKERICMHAFVCVI